MQHAPMKYISPIAARVIAKCGGHKAVADALDIDITRVYRFTYDTDRGGTNGLIPARHQVTLLSKFSGKLKPADFFDSVEAA